MMKQLFSQRRITAWLLVAAGVLCLLRCGYVNRSVFLPSRQPQEWEETHSVVLPEPEPFTVSGTSLPDDRLFITGERRGFQDGQLRLVIPKLGIDSPVMNGVSAEALSRGPGLYDYAQLPGTGNRNVSIAGHRDIHGSIFYSVDTLGENDYLYLIWDDTVYRYTYLDTTIVAPDDWGPIYSQGISCLTLTSCDPIGTSRNRIIVRAELSERTPFTPAYLFAASYQP